MKKYFKPALCIVIFILFAVKGLWFLDPDFGWHLKMGEYIIKHGIPTGDPFSYTMPSYPFVDHEWMTNVAVYLLYSHIGYQGLSLIFAALAAGLMSFLIRSQGWKTPLLLLSVLFCILFSFSGVRPQLISWLLTAIFVWILTDHPSKKALLIPLMVLWVNLHGGFFVGLGIVGIFILSETIKFKKLDIRNIILLLMMCVATLINPYRERVWWEVYMQLTDQALRFSIAEWMPAIFFLNLIYWLYAGYVSGLVIQYRKNIPLFHHLLYWIFFTAGIMSMRNIPLWVVVTIYPLKKGGVAFLKEANRNSYTKKSLQKATSIFYPLATLSIFIQLLVLGASLYESRTEKVYPTAAVEYIKKHHLDGRFFATYGWGGYLIWKLPGNKTFIDGRMPSWRREGAPPGESAYAYKEYGQFLENGKKMKEIQKKYNIAYVLFPPEKKDNVFEKWMKTLLSVKDKKETPILSLEKIYDDGVATIRKFK